jgi:hypothetical protein
MGDNYDKRRLAVTEEYQNTDSLGGKNYKSINS